MQEMSKAAEVQTQNNSGGEKQNLFIAHVKLQAGMAAQWHRSRGGRNS